MRRRNRALLAALLTPWLCSRPATAQIAASQTVRFFDNETGLLVEPRQVRLDGTTLTSRDPRFVAAYRLNLTAGEHQVQAFAPGYRNLTFPLRAFDTVSSAEAMVEPVTGPPEFATDAIRAKLSPDSALVLGFVGDNSTGRALAGVRISTLGVEALTNERGFFSLKVPLDADARGGPAVVTVTFSRDGYRTDERRNVYLYSNNALKYRLRLQPGTGIQQRDEGGPAADRAAPQKPALPRIQELVDLLLGSRPAGVPPAGSPPGAGSSLIPKNWRVPSSIRVGRDCKTPITCAAIEILSLDQYCKRVLPSEWVPAWNDEALKAGSVAVRSYATWYHNSRAQSAYDICDNPSCQYFGPRTYLSTDLSVDATRSLLVTRDDGMLVKIEYSAEANDTGCGDGKTADCIDDTVCAGSRARGHGRGMCQTGSHRWAEQGKNWQWILLHYFPSFRIAPAPKRP